MTRLQVTGGTGGLLVASPAACQTWVPSVSDCLRNDSGWSAVLLSQTGAWLDSYPSTTNESAWAIPNVIMSSQDRLVLVSPEAWNLSADTVNVLAAPVGPPVTGSVALGDAMNLAEIDHHPFPVRESASE